MSKVLGRLEADHDSITNHEVRITKVERTADYTLSQQQEMSSMLGDCRSKMQYLQEYVDHNRR